MRAVNDVQDYYNLKVVCQGFEAYDNEQVAHSFEKKEHVFLKKKLFLLKQI